jgi:iron complex outermembrane receptor protein
VSGRRNPYSPEFTVSAGLEYDFALANGDRLTPRLDTAYIGEQTVSVFENPLFDFLEARQIWNAQLTYEHQAWRAVAFVTNVSDEVYVSGKSGDSQFYGAPRQYGLRLARSF